MGDLLDHWRKSSRPQCSEELKCAFCTIAELELAVANVAADHLRDVSTAVRQDALIEFAVVESVPIKLDVLAKKVCLFVPGQRAPPSAGAGVYVFLSAALLLPSRLA